MNVFGVRPRIAGSKFFPPERVARMAPSSIPAPPPEPAPASRITDLPRSGRTVVRLVAKRFDLAPADIINHSGARVYQAPRRMVAIICRRELGYTAGQIGAIINRTRETTSDMLQMAGKQMTKDPMFASGVEHISEILRTLK